MGISPAFRFADPVIARTLITWFLGCVASYIIPHRRTSLDSTLASVLTGAYQNPQIYTNPIVLQISVVCNVNHVYGI